MNTDTRHILGHFETPRSGFDYFDDWYHSYTSASLKDRITSPSVVVTTLLVLGSFAYQTVYRQGYVPPILRLVWNLLVFIIPARILYMLDEVLNPDLDFPSMRITKPRTHAAKSETLRRVLCLDRAGDLLKSVSGVGLSSFNSFSHVASVLGGDKIFESNPPGLVNYNNSCYQNSILQGLASLKQLPHYLSTVLQERSCDAAPAYTVEALRKLIADLHSFSNSGKTLGAPGALQRMNSWQQQDAQEYYSKVMDEIDKELAKYVRRTPATALEFDWSRDDSSSSQHSDDSGYYSSHSQSKFAYDIRSTRNPLEGLIAQRVACVRCGYCEGLSMIPFNCLTLNLGNSQEHNVYERLDHYTKLELIEGVQCNKCTLLDYRERLKTLIHTHPNLAAGVQQRIATVEGAIEEDDFDDEAVRARCKVPQRSWVSSVKTKQACIARPPPCLVLHMNRSVFDETTGFQYKNYAAVRFPTLLDLGPWVVGSAMNQTSEDADSDVEEWATNPRVSMVAGGGRPSRVSGPIYELRAVVAHMGRHENGHYVCYRKHPKSTPPREVRFGQEPTPPPPQLASEDDTAADSPSPNANDTVEYVGSDNEQWWRFSDQQVSKVSEDEVLAQGGVFMLFYETVDPGTRLALELLGRDDDKISSTASEIMNSPVSMAQLSSLLAEAAGVALPDDSDSD